MSAAPGPIVLRQHRSAMEPTSWDLDAMGIVASRPARAQGALAGGNGGTPAVPVASSA